ncbi:MAG: hypothetical protein R2852_06990 [Bacteroidia bacterium]
MSENNKQANHPKGLYYLFFTEMWERFGYYLMLGIFSLFMLDSVENGGMGFSALKKSDIYEVLYRFSVSISFYRWFISRSTTRLPKVYLIGGLLMSAGYICLGLPDGRAFYLALFLIILGNGFFKPNISTMVVGLATLITKAS